MVFAYKEVQAFEAPEKEKARAIFEECFVQLRDDPTVAGADKLRKTLERQMKAMD